MNSRLRALLRALLWLIGLYVMLVICMTVFQRQFAYAPAQEDPSPGTYGAAHMQEVTYTNAAGIELEGWYKAPERKGAPVIVFFHGNAGHLGTRAYKSVPYTDAGYGFLFAGYRGYSGNSGKPTEQGLYQDARAALDWVRERHRENPLIYYGESLGTAVAVHTATQYKSPAAIILEAPFTNAVDVGRYRYFFLPVDWLLWDRYDSLAKILELQSPLLVYHGTEDTIIPFEMGQALFVAAPEPKTLIRIEDAGHNDIFSANVAGKVIAFLKRHDLSPPPRN